MAVMVGMRMALGAAVGLAGCSPLAAAPPRWVPVAPVAPWQRLQAELGQSVRARLAVIRVRPASPCGAACETRYNQHLIQCFGLPRGGLRTECLTQALDELEACVAACSGH